MLLKFLDCVKVIVKISNEEDELSVGMVLNKFVDWNVCLSDEFIDVVVNGEKKLDGRFVGSEVFVLFFFVKEYFDIYGEF